MRPNNKDNRRALSEREKFYTSLRCFMYEAAALVLCFLRIVGGGVFGYAIMVAMKNGFARGVFSNEAGLGSAPIAHAASSTEEPAEQAIWGVFEVFFDTIVICSITAFTVLLSGFELSEAALAGYASKGAAAVAAFNAILPGTLGGTIIQLSMVFFALSTILSWSYYG